MASLYETPPKIYPQGVTGYYRRLKWIALAVLLAIYYLVPWIRWNRGSGIPDQAVLLDMPGRRGYFFGIEIWPQEVYYLAILLVLGAFGLFLVTALLGRVWCGYACPQTVWTDLFMQVERWIEGDRNKRIKLDNEPLSLRRIVLKVTKHAAWLIIALLTGGAWIMYFNDAPTLLHDLAHFQASTAQYGFIGLFTGTTYLLAGWAREQVCVYMCPWPRFQSAMFDDETMLVTYEAWRGEPRGRVKRNADTSVGDCVDCRLCINVCPTGVDIREGQQLACIGCGLCIDACNSVMKKLGRRDELITYDSLFNQARRELGQPLRRRFVRARTVLYTVIILAISAATVTLLFSRSNFDVSVLADRAPLFVRLSDGDIQNSYTLKILNKTHQTVAYQIDPAGIDNLSTKIIGSDTNTLSVAADSVGTYRMITHAPRSALHMASTRFLVTVQNLTTRERRQHEAIFSSPN